MMGPPSSKFTSTPPMTGTRLAIDAPMPSPPVRILIEAHHLPGETPCPASSTAENTPRIQVSSRGNL